MAVYEISLPFEKQAATLFNRVADAAAGSGGFQNFKEKIASSFKLLRNASRRDGADRRKGAAAGSEDAAGSEGAGGNGSSTGSAGDPGSTVEGGSAGGASRAALQALEENDGPIHLQVGRTVWEGVPPSLRTELWLSAIVGVDQALLASYSTFAAAALPQEVENDIDKDVPRTYPSYRQFATEAGRDSLRRVLRAYAYFDIEVGYCQGMNFLAGLLLFYMPDEAHAFAGLVMLMKERNLQPYYGRSMSLLQVQLWQLGKLMPSHLSAHLEAAGVVPVMYAASWLMTCFSADFPVAVAARILDVLLTNKCEAALLKVAVTLMSRAEAKLVEMGQDLEKILTYLKVEIPEWDVSVLHEVVTEAFSKPWTPRQLTILHSLEGAETVAQAMDRVYCEAAVLQPPDNSAGEGCTGGSNGGGEGGEEGGESGAYGEDGGRASVGPLSPLPRGLHSSGAGSMQRAGSGSIAWAHATGSHGGMPSSAASSLPCSVPGSGANSLRKPLSGISALAAAAAAGALIDCDPACAPAGAGGSGGSEDSTARFDGASGIRGTAFANSAAVTAEGGEGPTLPTLLPGNSSSASGAAAAEALAAAGVTVTGGGSVIISSLSSSVPATAPAVLQTGQLGGVPRLTPPPPARQSVVPSPACATPNLVSEGGVMSPPVLVSPPPEAATDTQDDPAVFESSNTNSAGHMQQDRGGMQGSSRRPGLPRPPPITRPPPSTAVGTSSGPMSPAAASSGTSAPHPSHGGGRSHLSHHAPPSPSSRAYAVPSETHNPLLKDFFTRHQPRTAVGAASGSGIIISGAHLPRPPAAAPPPPALPASDSDNIIDSVSDAKVPPSTSSTPFDSALAHATAAVGQDDDRRQLAGNRGSGAAGEDEDVSKTRVSGSGTGGGKLLPGLLTPSLQLPTGATAALRAPPPSPHPGGSLGGAGGTASGQVSPFHRLQSAGSQPLQGVDGLADGDADAQQESVPQQKVEGQVEGQDHKAAVSTPTLARTASAGPAGGGTVLPHTPSSSTHASRTASDAAQLLWSPSLTGGHQGMIGRSNSGVVPPPSRQLHLERQLSAQEGASGQHGQHQQQEQEQRDDGQLQQVQGSKGTQPEWHEDWVGASPRQDAIVPEAVPKGHQTEITHHHHSSTVDLVSDLLGAMAAMDSKAAAAMCDPTDQISEAMRVGVGQYAHASLVSDCEGMVSGVVNQLSCPCEDLAAVHPDVLVPPEGTAQLDEYRPSRRSSQPRSTGGTPRPSLDHAECDGMTSPPHTPARTSLLGGISHSHTLSRAASGPAADALLAPPIATTTINNTAAGTAAGAEARTGHHQLNTSTAAAGTLVCSEPAQGPSVTLPPPQHTTRSGQEEPLIAASQGSSVAGSIPPHVGGVSPLPQSGPAQLVGQYQHQQLASHHHHHLGRAASGSHHVVPPGTTGGNSLVPGGMSGGSHTHTLPGPALGGSYALPGAIISGSAPQPTTPSITLSAGGVPVPSQPLWRQGSAGGAHSQPGSYSQLPLQLPQLQAVQAQHQRGQVGRLSLSGGGGSGPLLYSPSHLPSHCQVQQYPQQQYAHHLQVHQQQCNVPLVGRASGPGSFASMTGSMTVIGTAAGNTRTSHNGTGGSNTGSTTPTTSGYNTLNSSLPPGSSGGGAGGGGGGERSFLASKALNASGVLTSFVRKLKDHIKEALKDDPNDSGGENDTDRPTGNSNSNSHTTGRPCLQNPDCLSAQNQHQHQQQPQSRHPQLSMSGATTGGTVTPAEGNSVRGRHERVGSVTAVPAPPEVYVLPGEQPVVTLVPTGQGVVPLAGLNSSGTVSVGAVGAGLLPHMSGTATHTFASAQSAPQQLAGGLGGVGISHGVSHTVTPSMQGHTLQMCDPRVNPHGHGHTPTPLSPTSILNTATVGSCGSSNTGAGSSGVEAESSDWVVLDAAASLGNISSSSAGISKSAAHATKDGAVPGTAGAVSVTQGMQGASAAVPVGLIPPAAAHTSLPQPVPVTGPAVQPHHNNPVGTEFVRSRTSDQWETVGAHQPSQQVQLIHPEGQPVQPVLVVERAPVAPWILPGSDGGDQSGADILRHQPGAVPPVLPGQGGDVVPLGQYAPLADAASSCSSEPGSPFASRISSDSCNGRAAGAGDGGCQEAGQSEGIRGVGLEDGMLIGESRVASSMGGASQWGWQEMEVPSGTVALLPVASSSQVQIHQQRPGMTQSLAMLQAGDSAAGQPAALSCAADIKGQQQQQQQQQCEYLNTTTDGAGCDPEERAGLLGRASACGGAEGVPNREAVVAEAGPISAAALPPQVSLPSQPESLPAGPALVQAAAVSSGAAPEAGGQGVPGYQRCLSFAALAGREVPSPQP